MSDCRRRQWSAAAALGVGIEVAQWLSIAVTIAAVLGNLLAERARLDGA